MWMSYKSSATKLMTMGCCEAEAQQQLKSKPKIWQNISSKTTKDKNGSQKTCISRQQAFSFVGFSLFTHSDLNTN